MKKLFKLENLIFVTIIFMPLYLVRMVIFGVPTNLFELMAMFAVLVSLRGSVGSEIELQGYKKYFIPIGAIILGLLISTLYNDTYRVGFGIIKSWFIVPIIFAFMAVEVLDKVKEKSILNAIYFSALSVACISIAYFLLGIVTFDGRLQAIFNSPNYLAMFLFPAIIIGVAKLVENKNPQNGLFDEPTPLWRDLVPLLIMLSVLYLTFSYAAWLATIVALGVLFFKKENVKNLKGMAVLMLVSLMIIFLQIGTTKLNNIVHYSDRSSLSSRLMIWRSAGKIIADNPIIGIGPGNFQVKYLEYQKHFSPYLEWAVPQPHNIFLAFWLQAGILGLIGFSWLLAVWLKDLFKKKDKISVVCLVIMAGIMVYGLFDTIYFKNDLAVIFWLIFWLAIKKSPRK